MITPDQIIRSDRKTLSVTVDCFGNVTVRAPKKCDEGRIFAFLKDKEAWILHHKTKAEKTDLELPQEDLNGYSFLLLGEKCTITLTQEKFVRFEPQTHRIFLPEKNAKQRLVKWLKENALRIFTVATEKRAREMGTSFVSVRVSSARGRWGSCTHDNRIRYTFRLIYAPKEVIDYVVVHELAHTKYKNHSSAFWREVEKYLPDYKLKRKWLKERNILMRIF